MREIVLDTETTGLDAAGDRLIEVGCIELVNSIPTGRTWHKYINPERPVSAGAATVHGLDDAFLSGKPVFAAVAASLLDFIADSPLIAHNAGFDREFLNMELGRCGLPALPEERFVDTLALARRRHPGGSNSLDALCARYNVDNAARVKHGALLDAQILSEVYVELTGGRQASLLLEHAGAVNEAAYAVAAAAVRERSRPLAPRLDEAARQLHRAFVLTLSPNAVWQSYWSADSR